MAAFLERILVEVFRDAREIDVVPGEVRVHGMVYVGDVVLDVDLLIECVLALLEKCEVRAKESERLSATGCWILASRMGCSGGVRVARKRRSVSQGRGQRASSEDQHGGGLLSRE